MMGPTDLEAIIRSIAADDDAGAAEAFAKHFPDQIAVLQEAAEANDAKAVLRELNPLTTPQGNLDHPELEVRLQGHSVLFGRDHAYLMIIVDDHPAYEDDPRFQRQLEDGRRYATLGAGPRNMNAIFGTLVSKVNRAWDASPLMVDTFDIELQHPDVVAGLRTERSVVDQLFAVDARYDDHLDYDIVPFRWSDGYNSNSFLSGLLEVTGWNAERPGKVPGWTKPVPAKWFCKDDEEPSA